MTKIMLKREGSMVAIDVSYTPIGYMTQKVRTPDFIIEVMEL